MKIIIDNRSSKPMNEVINHVKSVIDMGRVSDNGKSYCFVTSFNDKILVIASKNKSSDTFIIQDDKHTR